MAEMSLKDFLEFSALGEVFREKYEDKPSVRDIAKETGLPQWFIYELVELGYITKEGIVSREGLMYLNMAMYCNQSFRFIKSALGRLSHKRQAMLIEGCGRDRVETWALSRLKSYTEQKQTICAKDIYREVCYTFPKFAQSGDYGFKKICKLIDSYKRGVRRQKKRTNEATCLKT